MRAIARLAITYLVLVVASNAAEDAASRTIEGVIATFRITTPIIKHGDTLKVTTVYQNTSWQTVRFPFMDPSHFSYIFRKGEKDHVTGYYIGTPAVWDVTLKPWERVELEEEVDLHAFEELPPGDYEIQFCFHLGMLPAAIQGNYPREYPYDSLVIPWSGRKYPFTIAN